MNNIICDSNPDLIIHLAAESHVDRSLEEPKFYSEHILGIYNYNLH